jgi:DNA-binding transcriptional ArsR family regulator
MTAAALTLLDEPGRLRVALSPMRRQLLDRLRTPASATQLATEMTVARQRINYHLRELERAGFIELVEERQRRGCVERILAARAQTFVVDPMVVSAPEPTPGGDRSKATRARAQTVRPEVQDR